MILFDLRAGDGDADFIAAVNSSLDRVPGNPYLARFGPVCSPQWWDCLDRGEIPVVEMVGVVTHAGPRLDDFDEDEDVVEIDCDGTAIAFDRLGRWAAHPVRVKDRVQIKRTEVEIRTPTGSSRFLIDLAAEWFPSGGGRPR
ncbi:hypothetical protein TA3x_000626 [Tundrisphaera sp. TA3]|uniref:hypothetical protein n=1 Tax=Tundrisphaera sp. TA3 TaxID=3435775 RepID=UPI003EBC6188